MDITAVTFPDCFPSILNDISTSCFVSVDFELSGVVFKPSTPQSQAQTVQERYVEAKAAAERYQILQVGLTTCHEDKENATYTLKPYNINLSPITQHEMDVNRDWTFGSRSMEFLLANHFSIDHMCTFGVRYLSREEEKLAIKRATEKCYSRNPVQVADIKKDDHESLEFLEAVRISVNEWLAQGEKRREWLNIPPPSSVQLIPGPIPTGLTSMQKWLIHHLISNEYPNLTSRGASTFVQIELRDPCNEQSTFETKLKVKKERVRKHIGFRWIAEALVGGSLEELEPDAFQPLMKIIEQPTFEIEQLSDKVKHRLKENRPVLVGHNMFCDLLFFHRCFLGPLPNTLAEFQTVIHDLFPMLADTKYMATHDCGSLNPMSSLEELNTTLAGIESPKIEIDPRFAKYKFRKRTHEAGYDSMLAAMAFIKLAGDIQRSPSQPTVKPGPQTNTAPSLVASIMAQPSNSQNYPKSEFSNFFDVDTETIPTIQPSQIARAGTSLADTGSGRITRLVNQGKLLPRLGDTFWHTYGNILRVFGTQERMVQLRREPPKQEELLVEV
ncbi:Ribonuclease CAF1 [Penicillium samsonianum]|uniref:Ribonuclease CAF1 n=1 Tax=Penicillium samsonianum TaxID=1882272 RepID=UPI0025471CEE|nr:Ribonuclease CAF1 [Penicillium samsonianum]XP_057133867.1 Ribonuclease CAF1 [Penicillium samsonianum]KAJ6118456.1 Ribonuclease CAF1 [Penicillium samsonianum]KAJ6129048.1 Ribonuclease CAF1 [Penicillium samsonianum]